MEEDPTKAYNQNDATGFIRLNGLRLRVNSTVNGAKNLANLKQAGSLANNRKVRNRGPADARGRAGVRRSCRW